MKSDTSVPTGTTIACLHTNYNCPTFVLLLEVRPLFFLCHSSDAWSDAGACAERIVCGDSPSFFSGQSTNLVSTVLRCFISWFARFPVVSRLLYQLRSNYNCVIHWWESMLACIHGETPGTIQTLYLWRYLHHFEVLPNIQKLGLHKHSPQRADTVLFSNGGQCLLNDPCDTVTIPFRSSPP